MAVQIVRSKGSFTLKVNQNGRATLTGKSGSLIFNGKTVLEAIGAKVKRVSILDLSGCSTFNNEVSLYQNFWQYKKSAMQSNNYVKYFSNKITGKINKKNSSQLLFFKYMNKEINNYEYIKNNMGCLTVNGVTSSKEPIAFYLEYRYTNGKWLISDIDVAFLDEIKNYPSKAMCPKEVRIK